MYFLFVLFAACLKELFNFAKLPGPGEPNEHGATTCALGQGVKS